jgi:pimeloyl-ACP methyl ester carboxylesterase
VAVRAVAILGLVAVVLLALVWAFQRRLVYLPGGPPAASAAQVLAGASEVELHTDDGLTLAAWHAPATGARRDATVLVLPGNAGSRADRVPLARALAARGFDVVLLDYRGYGGNPGLPTEEGLAADARAARRYLVDERGADPARVLLFGVSLGAAVAVRLARDRPVGGLVLRSPVTALADVGAVHYPFLPVRSLLRDSFPVREQVAGVGVPIIVVAGDADEVVPREQSRAVADAAGADVVEVAGARHNDPELSHGPAVVDAVVRVSG